MYTVLSKQLCQLIDKTLNTNNNPSIYAKVFGTTNYMDIRIM